MLFFSSMSSQELAQYQVGITLFLGLLLRDNALPGSTWNSVLDAVLMITNLSPSFATLFFMSHTHEPWKQKSLWRLWASCGWRGRGQGRLDKAAPADSHGGLNQTVDAPVQPSPSSLPRQPHQQPSVRVHIVPGSEKSSASIELLPSALPALSPVPAGVEEVEEEQDETVTFDASARTALLRPMETTTDPGSGVGTPLDDDLRSKNT